MIRHRLSADEILHTAQVIDGFEVDIHDHRLDYFLAELNQAADDTINEAAFIRWPDAAFGFAMLPADPPARRAALLQTYAKARAVLEWLLPESTGPSHATTEH